MQTSEYSGHVMPGGDALQRTIRHENVTLTLTKLSVGPMDNNCYLLADQAAGVGVIIDAAADAGRILRQIGDLRIETILTTHGHQDHWQALREVARATGARVVHHSDDQPRIPVRADAAVDHGDMLAFGSAALEIRHTPGHTDGSICAVLHGIADDQPSISEHLFSGDTLFPGGPGKTQSPDEFAEIMDSLRSRLFTLPDQTWVYPGHGDDTTLGDERGHLEAWQARGW